MRVMIDVSSLARDELTGIGVYIRHLVAELALDGAIDVVPVYRHRLHAQRETIAQHLPLPPQRYLPVLSDRSIDLYHGPDFRLPRTLTKPSVVTVHDLAVFEDDLLEPRFAQQGREKVRRLIERRRPDRIIAVSRFTAASLVARFPHVADRVDVVELGYDASVLRTGAALPTGVRAPFVLYVGTLERRKNVRTVIDAFETVRASMPQLQLVLAGGDGYDADAIHRRIDASRHGGSIVRAGFVDDATRASLLHAASAFVYPSLYEGFGLPVLEAMAAGCVVITSNAGALAEVAGDGALTVSPDAADVAQALHRVLVDDVLRASLVDAGRRRAATLTWERCAQATIEVYERALR